MRDLFLKQVEALSDKARLDILKEIAKQEDVSCAAAGCSTKLKQPTISHHIKILLDAGLIISKKKGREVKLSLNRKQFLVLSNKIVNFVD